MNLCQIALGFITILDKIITYILKYIVLSKYLIQYRDRP
nr:MAG TPA: hypothetical protein [Caudoviricetes sp.]